MNGLALNLNRNNTSSHLRRDSFIACDSEHPSLKSDRVHSKAQSRNRCTDDDPRPRRARLHSSGRRESEHDREETPPTPYHKDCSLPEPSPKPVRLGTAPSASNAASVDAFFQPPFGAMKQSENGKTAELLSPYEPPCV